MGRLKTRVEASCEHCGATFFRYPDQPQRAGRFCSRACYHAWRIGQPRGPLVERESKTCPVCGTVFIVGGFGNSPRTQRVCSVLCQQRSRYRRGRVANEMLPTEAAYLAGIMDGEGSVMLYLRRDAVAMRIVVSNTCRPLLEWIARVTGVGAVHNQYPEGRPSPLVNHRRATYNWGANADAAESILRQIRPYMVVKTAQADLALEVQERLRDPALKADRSWQAEWRDRMRLLNRPHLAENGG